MEMFRPKRKFSNKEFLLIKLSISTHSTNSMMLLLLNKLLQYSLRFINIGSLDRMRMEWAKHRSVGKKNVNKKKYLAVDFRYHSLLNRYLSLSRKQLSNETN